MASILKVNEIQHTGGNSAITVSSTGQVIPKCYAIRATTHKANNWTTGGASAGTAITFNNTTSYSAFNSGFNVSNLATDGKFHFPVDGIYRVSASFLTMNNNGAGNTYVTAAFNSTTGVGGYPQTTLQNCYDYVPANQHHLIKINLLVKATSSDYVCICKEDSMQYYGNGTNLASQTWGYNQCCIELIGSSV